MQSVVPGLHGASLQVPRRPAWQGLGSGLFSLFENVSEPQHLSLYGLFQPPNFSFVYPEYYYNFPFL